MTTDTKTQPAVFYELAPVEYMITNIDLGSQAGVEPRS